MPSFLVERFWLRYSLNNLKLRPCRFDQVKARSIRHGRSFRFCLQDLMFEVNKLFIVWLFLCFCEPVIGLWVLRENNALELANQSSGFTGHKHKPYNITPTTIIRHSNKKHFPCFHVVSSTAHSNLPNFREKRGKTNVTNDSCILFYLWLAKNITSPSSLVGHVAARNFHL